MVELLSERKVTDGVFITFDWNDIDQAVSLIEGGLGGAQFDVVVGIARSGLIPAVMLAHRLAIRDFVVLEIRRTATDTVNAPKQEPIVSAVLNEHLLKNRHALIVDDIVGEGLTMELAKSWLAQRCASVTSSTVVVNRGNLGDKDVASVVDHCGCIVHGWVRFPWEEELPVSAGAGHA